MINEALYVHIAFIGVMFAILIKNFYTLRREKSFIKLAKKIKFITPAFHISHSIVIFTGLLMEFISNNFSFAIHIMSVISVLIIILEAKRYKKMRVIKSKEVGLQANFIKFASKIYISEFLILLSFMLIYKLILT
jgi:hypothetical protein